MIDYKPKEQDVLRILKEAYAYIEDGHWCQFSSFQVCGAPVKSPEMFATFYDDIYHESNSVCALGAICLFSGSMFYEGPRKTYKLTIEILHEEARNMGYASIPDINDSEDGKILVRELFERCIAKLEKNITFESDRGLPLSPVRREEPELIPA